MEHLHAVTDRDSRFIIDPNTGEIQNLSGKESVRQFSHNSERFTFELPRYIEGHDMTQCNVVEVQFCNKDEKGAQERTGIYPVKDLQAVTPEAAGEEETVVCSWLIRRDSTKLAGGLEFQLRFACVEDGEITYDWPSDVFTGLKVTRSINASGQMAEDNADIIMQLSAQLDAMQQDVDKLKNQFPELFTSLYITFYTEADTLLIANVTKEEADRAYRTGREIIVSNKGTYRVRQMDAVEDGLWWEFNWGGITASDEAGTLIWQV